MPAESRPSFPARRARVAGRALPPSPAQLLPLLLIAALPLATGCGEDASAAREVPVEREIRDLVAALTPLSPGAGHAVQGDWYRRRTLTLDRLSVPDAEVGAAARAAFHEKTDAPVPVRVGLLEVAAHADPAGTEPELVRLFTEYGEDMQLRREASLLLGKVAPERAVELIEPVVRQPRQGATYPPAEFLFESVLTAKRALDQPLEDLLTELAVDIYQDERVRQMAVEALGDVNTVRSIKALEAVLTESTGNAFLRREAAQALLKSDDREARCATFRRVFDREADENFRLFLTDVINKSCR